MRVAELPPIAGNRWQITRMELVSLHKHGAPRVYVSETVPRMEDFSKVKTRELTAFETGALAKLKGGDDFGVEAGSDQIQMLGSLRISNYCAQCHDVPRGTLFGAFSYELRRDPPQNVDEFKSAAR